MQLLLDILTAEEHCHQSFKHLIKEASNLTDPSSPNNEEEEETTNDRQESSAKIQNPGNAYKGS